MHLHVYKTGYMLLSIAVLELMIIPHDQRHQMKFTLLEFYMF